MGASWERLTFDLSCDGGAGAAQAGKGRQGHSRQVAMRNSCCLWDYNFLGTTGMKLGVLGYQWLEAGRRDGKGQVMRDLGC